MYNSLSKKNFFGRWEINIEKRLLVSAIVINFAGIFIIARLFILMVLDHSFYKSVAANSQEVISELIPTRGVIYIQDSRNSEEYPLAINRDFFMVFADTREIKDDETAEEVAKKLAQVFKYDDIKKLALYLNLNKRDDPYEPLEQKVNEDVIDEIKKLNLPGIHFIRKPERFYPEGNLAASVVGFLGKDVKGFSVGRYGVEGYWHEELTGNGGIFVGARSAAGRLILLAPTSFKSPEDGSDILLTIDRTLQFKACERLRQGMEDYKAETASLVIMEPFSGAILAMCSLPDFDSNAYNEVDSVKVYNNSAIFNAYEPGSVFKPIVMAAALNEDVVKTATKFYDSGSAEAHCKKPIFNAGNKKYDEQTMVGVLENSINTGMVFVVEKLGKEKFRKYAEDFGFGVKTGLELDSESPGTLESLSKNKTNEFDCYTATASFGQGIMVTPLQMAAAFSAIANGGALLKPNIIKEIRHSDGRVEYKKPKEIRRVIDSETASLVSGMLVNVVDNGQAKSAKVKGYYVAGKTGTAQIAGPGGYTEDYNHSFAGFAPIENPKFVMVIKFEKPKVEYSANTAAPVFSDIAEFVLQYYQIPPNR